MLKLIGTVRVCQNTVYNLLSVFLVPGSEEIAFVLEFLDRIAGNALDKVETLLTQSKWDNVARNDFCRSVKDNSFSFYLS